MNTSTILLTLLLISNILNFVCTKDKYSDCKSTYTLGYGYKHIYHISESEAQHDDSSFTFNFWVKAFSDAHILLSPTSSPGTQDPVYEIVIGAGRNTFSTIRRQLLTQVKQRVITIDYLSDTEYRGFWIQVSKFGQIQVGRAEDNVPFMFWFDTEPLLIRYFSFCTWGSTVARWYYSCPNDTQSEEVDVPTKLTTVEQLRQDLLLHYDPFSRPILNENDTTYIFIHLTCQNIKVDEKKSVISIRGEVTMHWEDQKLQWKPQDYDNISLLTVLHHEVWQPELILYNAVGHGTDILTDTPLSVSSLGLVVWKSQASLQARCSLDLSHWPNDEHLCELQLGFWAQHDVLNLDLIGKGAMLKDEQHLSSEWDILSVEADPTNLETPWINTTTELKDNKALSIRLSLRRKDHAYKTILHVPLLVFGTMTLLSFWISPTDPNKMLLSCLNLVIMTMFIVALGAILPAPANQTPQIGFI
ncbi:acetylcholine receptor subunit beta-like 2 isoform X2 [Anabrus simplex]|uniref:acetylcholine receptor subunit beta-like 2 isoform X2 n=1 Tax=Anabrus simplex TaxID=316456 RepID=UPI0035A2CD42